MYCPCIDRPAMIINGHFLRVCTNKMVVAHYSFMQEVQLRKLNGNRFAQTIKTGDNNISNIRISVSP